MTTTYQIGAQKSPTESRVGDIGLNTSEPSVDQRGRTFWTNKWGGLPYNPISRHYREVFSDKVYKLPVSTATTCPNRDGLKGMKVCNFCDVWGSAAYPDLQKRDLKTQILEARTRVLSRVNAGAFLVYFQAYTTTFARVQELKTHLELAAEMEGIKGFVIGTRPDCISDALLELLSDWSQKYYVAVELGVQTFDEEQLLWMSRGHTAQKSFLAIKRISEHCPKVNLGIHLMFGLPNETDELIIGSAKTCNSLPIHNVKLHNLHVLENTPLADDFRQGRFSPIEREDYARGVTLFLQHLSPRIAVHRLAALASRSEELIAPQWTSKKMETYQYLLDYINAHSAYQGEYA